MSKPKTANPLPIARGVKQPTNVIIFERRTRTFAGREDELAQRLRALRNENAVLRRQAAILADYNENLRKRKTLEEHEGGYSHIWLEEAIA